MSAHKLFVCNAQYPRFTGSRPFGGRVDDVARMLLRSGADVASFSELGYNEAGALANELGGNWEYDRAQGKGRGVVGEGLNCVFRDKRQWTNPGERMHDWNLHSFGQWQRTLPLVRLAEAKDPDAFVWVGAFHFSAVGAPLGRAQANAAKLAQVKQVIDLVGNRRVLLGGDFPRTDDDDDEATFKRAGWTISARTSATPLCALSTGAVHVTGSQRIPHGNAFDHDAQVVSFTIPNPE